MIYDEKKIRFSRQLRAARGLLGMNMKRMSEESGVDSALISRIESGRASYHDDTGKKLMKVMQDHGITFVEDGDIIASGGYGVMIDPDVMRVSGPSDVEMAARKPNNTLVVGPAQRSRTAKVLNTTPRQHGKDLFGNKD
jgi:transcriptional regulator with XRE-family HTH domain